MYDNLDSHIAAVEEEIDFLLSLVGELNALADWGDGRAADDAAHYKKVLDRARAELARLKALS